MRDKLQKITANFVMKPYLKWYLKKERFYRFNNRKVKIYPTVFHPQYFFSTKVLLEFLDTLDLNGKTFCEVGAGSGVISFKAFEKGAIVTALDVNETAVRGLTENFGTLQGFNIVLSDLFDNVKDEKYHVLIINPPYFFSEIKDTGSLAWNCGAGGEYFHKLFSQLRQVIYPGTEIYIILAENCEVERIKNIARNYNFAFSMVHEVKIKWEKNYIFKVNYQEVEPRI